MKKIFFAFFVLAVIFVSCSKDSGSNAASDESISISSLSSSIVSYVDSYYPDASISSAVAVSNSKAATIVTLSTSEQLAFDDFGAYLGDGTNLHSGSDLSGQHRGRGGKGGHGGRGMDSIGKACDGQGSSRHVVVSIDSLPAAIQSYIATNYPSLSARHAEIDTTCQYGAVYKVMLAAVGSEPLKLAFNKESLYLFKSQRIRLADMPQAVKDAIASYDSSSRIRGEQISLADGTVQYTAYVNVSGVKKRLVFGADGSLVCQ